MASPRTRRECAQTAFAVSMATTHSRSSASLSQRSVVTSGARGGEPRRYGSSASALTLAMTPTDPLFGCLLDRGLAVQDQRRRLLGRAPFTPGPLTGLGRPDWHEVP